MMKVIRRSSLSGKMHTMDLPITQEEITRWEAGELVQNVFPYLTPFQREFLMTGVTEEEWENTFQLPQGDE